MFLEQSLAPLVRHSFEMHPSTSPGYDVGQDPTSMHCSMEIGKGAVIFNVGYRAEDFVWDMELFPLLCWDTKIFKAISWRTKLLCLKKLYMKSPIKV